MNEVDRKKLGRQQEELLMSLVRNGALPDGIGQDEIKLARRTLLGKRMREVELMAAMLTETLGSRFIELFREYATQCDYPRQGGPRADAAKFGLWLEKRSELPLESIREAIGLRMRGALCIRRAKAMQKRMWGLKCGNRIWFW